MLSSIELQNTKNYDCSARRHVKAHSMHRFEGASLPFFRYENISFVILITRIEAVPCDLFESTILSNVHQ